VAHIETLQTSIKGAQEEKDTVTQMHKDELDKIAAGGRNEFA
jgi:hypothetical protein